METPSTHTYIIASCHFPPMLCILTHLHHEGSVCSAIGYVFPLRGASTPSPWGSGVLVPPTWFRPQSSTKCLFALGRGDAQCHQGYQLAMWSVYWYYKVGLMHIGCIQIHARCRVLGVLVLLLGLRCGRH